MNNNNNRKIDRDRLTEIIKKYIEDYNSKTKNENLKKHIIGHIPIVWFGNIDAYENSPVRIVTVGLNPSNNEFQDGAERFDSSINIQGDKDVTDKLSNTLNGYFETNPYTLWFNEGFEYALNPMNASYYKKDGIENRAIHIDICTAIATIEKWRQGLPNAIKKGIQNTGLFNELLDVLSPDIIFLCIDQTNMKKNFKLQFFADGSKNDEYDWEWKYGHLYKDKKYKRITDISESDSKAQYIRIYTTKSVNRRLLIWGKTRDIPLGGFQRKGNETFKEIFKEIINNFQQGE